MAFKRRKKTTRYRGTHTHGRGFKKKARGSGHRGGFGMAGTGKRGDAKKTLILNLFGNDYFGKSKALRRGNKRAKASVMNLSNLESHLDQMVKNGKAKENKGAYELDLSGYKILGSLEGKTKLIIKARSASASAIESVQAAGGQLEVESSSEKEKSEDKKPVVKAEAKK